MKAELERKRNINEIWLLNKEEVQEMTGWSKATVTAVFQSRDFPALTIGKEYKVLNIALYEWMKQRRDIL